MNEELEGSVQLPPALGEYALEVDYAYYAVYWVSVAFTVLIFGFTFYYVWKYRRRDGVKAKPTGHSTAIEVAWTFLPLILLTWFFKLGWDGYVDSAVAPEDAIDVRVVGKKWLWDFAYPGGVAGEPNELVVPANQPVRLVMSSSDVIHSFYIPGHRIKRDVVPGMYTTLWFQQDFATPEQSCETDADCDPGTLCAEPLASLYANPDAEAEEREPYRSGRTCEVSVFCTEYCGTDHSAMLATLRVVPQDIYEGYVRIRREEFDNAPAVCENAENVEACWGQTLHAQQGCVACHAVDGETRMAGPNWAGVWGAERAFDDGTTATADLNYIQNSIRNPASQVLNGYGNVMPAFPNLTERQLGALAAYIEFLGNGPANAIPDPEGE